MATVKKAPPLRWRRSESFVGVGAPSKQATLRLLLFVAEPSLTMLPCFCAALSIALLVMESSSPDRHRPRGSSVAAYGSKQSP